MMGSVRRHVRIHRSADEVWGIIGDPTTMADWFPGVVECTVVDDLRTITTATGLVVPERLVLVDPVQRRLQYGVEVPLLHEHLGTWDVIDLDDGSCLVIAATNADPAALALVFAGATGHALEALRRQREAASMDPA